MARFVDVTLTAAKRKKHSCGVKSVGLGNDSIDHNDSAPVRLDFVRHAKHNRRTGYREIRQTTW